MQINKIEPPTVDLYNPNDEKIGTVNEYEFLDFLIQLKRNYVAGYYAMHNGERVNIIEDGKIHKQPEGFLDLLTNQLETLLGF